MMRDWLLVGIGFLAGQIVMVIWLYVDDYMQYLKAEQEKQDRLEWEAQTSNNVIVHGEWPPIDDYAS